MKNLTCRLASFVLAMAMMISVLGTAAFASEIEETTVTPRVHYDFDIGNLTVSEGDAVFYTRYGYGFSVNTEGLNHDSFKITFKTEGSSVNLTVALVTMDNYTNGNYDIYVATSNVTGAGNKTVKFNDLAQGTYVIRWVNSGTGTINVKNAHLDSSY